MKKMLVLLFMFHGIHIHAELATNNQSSLNTTLNGTSRPPNRGLVTELTNLPQTLSSMMPTTNNIQKLLLSAAVIKLGYQCCKYGLSKCNKATKLYNRIDETAKGKQKYAQCKWYTFTGGSFLIAGAFTILWAQKIADLAYVR